MVRVALVGIADARAQRMMALLPGVVGSLGLGLEGAAERLATGKFQHVVGNCSSFGAPFGARFDVYIWHWNFLRVVGSS